MTSEQYRKQDNKKYKYFVAKGIEVKESDDGTKTVTVPIQSTEQDRDGDTITESGQEKVLEYLKSGKVPAFPNHGFGEYPALYAFQDIMGKWVDGYTEDGITYGVLQPRKNNKSAEEMLDLIEQDMPLGFSIGFIVNDYTENDNGGMEISDLELLEVSPVGIPSNPLAVHGNNAQVAMAAKSAVENGGGYKEIKSAISKAGGIMTQEDESKTKNSEDETVEQEAPKSESEDENKTLSEETKETKETEEPEGEEESKSEESETSKETDEEDEEDDDKNSELKQKLEQVEGEVQSLKERVEKLEKQEEEDEDEDEEDETEEDSGKSAPEDDENKSSDEDKDSKSSVPNPKKIKTAEVPEEKDFNILDDEPVGYDRMY